MVSLLLVAGRHVLWVGVEASDQHLVVREHVHPQQPPLWPGGLPLLGRADARQTEENLDLI